MRFSAIILAALLPLLKIETQLEISIITGISGVLLQFIGGAVFVFPNKTLEQLNRFYDRLVKAQDTMLAIELCDRIKDANTNSEMTKTIILTLLKRNQENEETRTPQKLKDKKSEDVVKAIQNLQTTEIDSEVD